ncbi:6-phosphogluconolactonase [Brevundimonas viscosa]|uniref:6-phosphogluconolactonase n=1 Tax=Brevundimonas viscosa TaxID=871741 RepID=A0A1I6NQG2_9CAUL|nr:6-phosphogluconolactonase [Brevundimonas viscosa]SFS30178.1 6-phosphogluconolactonase [Brevundimonas viscosa]
MAEVRAFSDAAVWAEACADRLADALSAAIAADGAAFLAGAGGSTPGPVYQRLAAAPLDWSRVTATLVDERYVPEASDKSNARLLKQSLLTGPAASARFVPLYSEQITVDRAGLLAAHALRAVGRPLDAVLLGMGEDGHICSMFPDNPALKQLLAPNNPPLVLAVHKSRSTSAPQEDRLSMNLPWLAQARRVVLALTGAKKREVFEREVGGDPSVSPIAALVAARAGDIEVLWTEAAR